MDKRQIFFSGRNKSIIYNNVSRAAGIQLSESQTQRLDKMIRHYMREVWSVQNAQPIPLLNREVTNVTQQQFLNSLPATTVAAAAPAPAPASATIRASRPAVAPQPQPQPQTEQMGTFLDDLATSYTVSPRPQPSARPHENVIFQDTTKTLEQLQKERQGTQPERPPPPDFRISSEDEDGPSPLELYEMAKKAREAEEASRPPPQNAPTPSTHTVTNSIETNDVFRQILGPDIKIPTGMATLPPPIKTKKDTLGPRIASTMLLDAPMQPSGKQHTLIRQDDIQQYKEVEENLFVNSLDRDWTKDSLFDWNRYNFTVNFDPSAQSQNANLTPFSQKKFKNIVRIQLIKIIVARESLDTLITRTAYNTPATTSQVNVLSYPSVVVRIAELDGNNYGTNDQINNAFGLIHYDAQWTADPNGSSAVPSSGITTSNGFVSLIPKFLTCQRTYEPTPLATLTKLSIRLEQPYNNTLISDTADTLQISSFMLGTNVGATSIYRSGVAPSQYIFIETARYFSKFMWESGDRIFFRNIGTTLGGSPTSTTTTSINDMSNFLNNPDGHIIVAVGVKGGTWAAGVTDGANSVGYANVIIIETLAGDYEGGSTAPSSFGNEGDITTALANTDTTFTGTTINASHQVQAVFRIVSREYDPAAKLRPDNLN